MKHVENDPKKRQIEGRTARNGRVGTLDDKQKRQIEGRTARNGRVGTVDDKQKRQIEGRTERSGRAQPSYRNIFSDSLTLSRQAEKAGLNGKQIEAIEPLFNNSIFKKAIDKKIFSLQDFKLLEPEQISKLAQFALLHENCLSAIENGETNISLLASMDIDALKNAVESGSYLTHRLQ